ncbi:uncharacterized protein LOC119381402 [Rhipicephalus sanguineus]|uniref:uncharacterized protein LOC119381402 n=1 Tax=Rhipicephalus sanguineus TaxID=34632 RepID=UPI0020C39074|nr:uncharacterized protein LOC119381402 [Rhipicephalus sanguineus]
MEHLLKLHNEGKDIERLFCILKLPVLHRPAEYKFMEEYCSVWTPQRKRELVIASCLIPKFKLSWIPDSSMRDQATMNVRTELAAVTQPARADVAASSAPEDFFSFGLQTLPAETQDELSRYLLVPGERHHSLSRQFRVEHSTVNQLIEETCVVIYLELKDEFLKSPKVCEDCFNRKRIKRDYIRGSSEAIPNFADASADNQDEGSQVAAIRSLGAELEALGDLPFAAVLQDVQAPLIKTKAGLAPADSPLTYQQSGRWLALLSHFAKVEYTGAGVSVWVCVVFAMMTLSLFSTGLDRFYEQQWATYKNVTLGRKRFRCGFYVEHFLAHAWEYFENLLGKGSSSPPGRQASRVVTAFWWLAVTVLVFAFAGQMRACLMVKSQEAVIRNIRDLAQRSSVRPYTLAGSILTAMLRDSRNPAYQKVFERIMRYGGQTELHRIYGQPILEQVVRGKAVVIADRGSFTYKVSSTCRNYTDGEFYIAEEPILKFRFVMYLSKKMDMRMQRGINQRLVWLREMGIMDRWIAQMLGNWDHCRRDSNRVTLTFEDTYAIFVMWALLVTASLAAFGFEKLRYACSVRKIRLH